MLQEQNANNSRATSNQLLEQLSRNSTPYSDPLSRVNWHTLNTSSYWMPEEAISLYGLPVFDQLSEEQKKALSQYEFMNFVEAGLWLENIFMTRIIRQSRNTKRPIEEQLYHLHELREEAGHSLMFLELLRRSGPLLPNTRFHKWDFTNMLARYAPFDSEAFWIAILIGEETPDRMNRFIRKHKDTICPAIYDIVTLHVLDEARHIAHARDVLQTRFMNMSRLKKKLVSPIVNYVFRQFVRAYYYPDAHIYEMAGLTPGSDWKKMAKKNPHRIRFVNQCLDSSLRSLREHGIHLTLSETAAEYR